MFRPSCQAYARYVSDQAEGRKFPLRTRLLMAMHFFMCAMCQGYAREIDRIIRLVRSTAPDDLADDQSLQPATRERIIQAMTTDRRR